MPTPANQLRACPCCGLVQDVPDAPPRLIACCARCGAALRSRSHALRGNRGTAAIALAALVIYPLAVTLPIMQIEQFGHSNATSVLGGSVQLFAGGHILVGLIVLCCSIVFPLGKLIALLLLSAGGRWLPTAQRAWTFRVVEWTGRWGMLDVLLVALLVAVMKLGDWVDVSAGPAAFAFALCVVLSLLATVTFDPHALWETNVETGVRT